jgi:Zn-dependent alcohol dehydrogenase
VHLHAYMCVWVPGSVCVDVKNCSFQLSVLNNGVVLLGLGAAWNVADISKGSTVVIFGLGTVGLSVSILA